MQKTATLLLLAAAVPAFGQSPVVLTSASFPASATTVESYQDASLPLTQTPAATGANQTWDYRNLQPDGMPYTVQYYPVPSGNAFSGAQWTRQHHTTVGTLAYELTTYLTLAPTGRMALGRTVNRQAFSLAPRTGGANDSIVLHKQTLPYGGPGGIVDFPLPLQMGTRSEQRFRVKVAGMLTVASAGLNRVPFELVQRYVYVDSVAGWGTLRIPAAGRVTGSDLLPVLQVRSRTIRQDSVYINGRPAPATLLAAFNMTQGAVTPAHYYHFWRTGSAQPVLELFYPNSRFQQAYYAAYSTESNVLANRASSALAAAWQAWPNPLTTGQPLQLTLPGARHGQPVQLTVLDGLGRAVVQQMLPVSGGAAVLPEEATRALRPGLYTVLLQQGAEQASLRLLCQ